MDTAQSVSTASTEDKTVAILSYVTLIGFIAAIVIHSSKKTKLGAYHLRQTLGLYITCVAVAFCQIVLAFVPVLGFLMVLALWFCMLALWIMGLLAAVNGEMKPMPIVGPLYQQWFGTTFD